MFQNIVEVVFYKDNSEFQYLFSCLKLLIINFLNFLLILTLFENKNFIIYLSCFRKTGNCKAFYNKKTLFEDSRNQNQGEIPCLIQNQNGSFKSLLVVNVKLPVGRLFSVWFIPALSGK